MQREITVDSLEQFVSLLMENEISKVAMAEVKEKRSVQVDPDHVQVVQVSKVDLLAYRDSVLYKCVINNPDTGAVSELLRTNGLDVTRSNRNIT